MYVKQKLTKLKREISKSTTIVGDFYNFSQKLIHVDKKLVRI